MTYRPIILLINSTILNKLMLLAAGKAEGGLITKGAAKEAAEEGMQLLKTATAILQVNL